MRQLAKFAIAWVVVAFLWSKYSTLINVDVLPDEWALVRIFRTWPEESRRLIYLNAGYALWAGAAVWMCAQYMTRRGGPWIARGLELGLFMSLVTHTPMMMSNYTTYPLPGPLTVKEILYFAFFTMAVGIALAFFYRKEIEAGTPAF